MFYGGRGPWWWLHLEHDPELWAEPEPQRRAAPLFELADVHFGYGDGTEALRAVSLTVKAGNRVALVGGNGAGKSTLLLLLNGMLRPRQGVVRFRGEALCYGRRALLELRREVGLLFQNPETQLLSGSVAQDIAFGPLNLGLGEAEVRQRVAAAAEAADVGDLLDRPTHALSGGQKMRVALAGVLAMEPAVLVADEPTAGLDPRSRDRLLAIFGRLHAQGTTLIIATHDLDFAYGWADTVVLLGNGQVVACGPPRTVFADAPQLACYGLNPPLLMEVAALLHRRGLLTVAHPRTLAELAAGLVMRLIR
ncbi:MAG TPA: ATP-binding cassette domain-containing protein [Herpetosiphonaceae bacterium]|nr:ATP-binding cassette domain-containing protein [Herpetosiphonaceae bacterium]